jgi:hypothetical protein
VLQDLTPYLHLEQKFVSKLDVGLRHKLLTNTFNIFHADYVQRSLFPYDTQPAQTAPLGSSSGSASASLSSLSASHLLRNFPSHVLFNPRQRQLGTVHTRTQTDSFSLSDARSSIDHSHAPSHSLAHESLHSLHGETDSKPQRIALPEPPSCFNSFFSFLRFIDHSPSELGMPF